MQATIQVERDISVHSSQTTMKTQQQETANRYADFHPVVFQLAQNSGCSVSRNVDRVQPHWKAVTYRDEIHNMDLN